MKDKILFSIIIPTYNRATFISKAIESVLKQTYQHFELIIVDDGSTDNTEEVVKNSISDKITYCKTVNSERAAARNFGTLHSKGDYVTFLDSDDILLPNYLKNACESVIKFSHPPFLHLGYEIVKNNTIVQFRINKLKNDDIKFLVKGNSLSCTGCFMRADISRKFLFNEDRNLSGSEDWELWLRVLANNGIKTDNRISARMFNHESRSIVSEVKENKLVTRIALALKYSFEDKQVQIAFNKYHKQIYAFGDSYIALHLALMGDSKKSVSYLYKFIKNYPPGIFSMRFLAIIKHITLNKFDFIGKKNTIVKQPYSEVIRQCEYNKVNIIDPQTNGALSLHEKGYIDNNGKIFPKINGVYRFVENQGYTLKFGFQWKKFQKTQIDKFNGLNFTHDRFFKVTGWDKENLERQNILEVGSGAGRFSQIVLDFTKANLYSIDYSESVEANYENNGSHSRLNLFQANVYEMPFDNNSFDKIFCFGVLQHTPDVKKTIDCLYKVLKPGGELIIDFYPYKGFWTKINAKYLFRPFLKKLPEDKLLSIITYHANWMIKLSKFLIKIKMHKIANRFIPICDFTSTLPYGLTKEQEREWVILDTFDMFSPQYDNPQKISYVKDLFKQLQMKNVFGGYMMYGNNYKIAIVKGIK